MRKIDLWTQEKNMENWELGLGISEGEEMQNWSFISDRVQQRREEVKKKAIRAFMSRESIANKRRRKIFFEIELRPKFVAGDKTAYFPPTKTPTCLQIT